MDLKLIEMAQDKSPEARGLLLLAITDTVIEKIDECSETEMEFFGEIALILYDTTSQTDLEMLAKKVAPYARMPVQLAKRLAEDHIRVASPVLSKYKGFSEEDLLSLASKLGHAHLQILAKRPDLTIRITDIVVIRGSYQTHLNLSGNNEIKLSPKSFLNLIHLAKSDPDFLETLLARPDLTPGVCQELFPNVDAEVQQQLRKIIKGTLSQEQRDKLVRLREVKKLLGPSFYESDTSKLWAKCQFANIKKDELIGALLQDDRLEQVGMLLSKFTRTQLHKTRSILFNGPANEAARLALSAELDQLTFGMLAQARCKKMRIPPSKAEEWVKSFESLKLEEADSDKEDVAKGWDFAARRKKRPEKLRGRRRRIPPTNDLGG